MTQFVIAATLVLLSRNTNRPRVDFIGVRIGINSLFLIPGEVGGSETYLTETLREMLRASPDCAFTVYTNIENHSYFSERFSDFQNIQLQPVQLKARNRLNRIVKEQTALPHLTTKNDTDVLWSPGYTSPLFIRCPQVVSVLDMQYRRFPEDLSLAARAATRLLVPAAIRCSTSIITISEFAKSEILHFVDVRPDKIHVTPLAPGATACDMPTADTITRLTGSNEPYLLCVANTYPHKNVHTLINAFTLLAGNIPHRLVLVGRPGRGEEQARAATERSSAKERILRLDYLPRSDLEALYAAADAFVFPSLYEGFGLPVLEAMIMGTPVITTRCGSIPEVAGEHVVYCDDVTPACIASKIQLIVKMDVAARRLLITKARNHAMSTFSWQRTAAMTLECLTRAANGRN